MRLKYLFGSLLGGALLAACTADDALDANLTAQEANPYAPVFTISMDDKDALGTRVEAIPNKDGVTMAGKLKFEAGDLLTLFHGENITGFPSGLTGAKNAIYKAEEGDVETGLTLRTQSMVDAGYAVMVWPSDTTFASINDNGVYVKISLDQKYKNEGSNHKRWQEDGTANFHQLEEDTWLGTPYISEILDIEGYGSYEQTNSYNKNTTAGYGRNYDIKLKQIGSTMRLKVIREKEEDLTKITRADGKPAKGITFKSVKIETEDNDGTANPFTSKIKVIAKNETPKGHTITGARSIWAKVSEVEVDNIGEDDASTEIVTNHIVNAGYNAKDNTSTAYFTLLPTNVIKEQDEDATQVPEPDYETAKVIIETYYGTVEVEGTVAGKNSKDGEYNQVTTDEEQLQWYKNYGKETEEKYSVRGGLNEFLTVMYSTAGATGEFEGEKIGHSGERQLVVDMTKIKMNGKLHIVDEDQLLDVMAVYETITKNSEEQTIALYLDGDKNNEFEMHQATWEQVVKEMQKGRLKFIPCQKTGEKCDYIKLIADKDCEVPVLNFGKDSENTSTTKAVTVRLAGQGKNWTYEDTENLAGIDVLEVVAGTKLELKGRAKVDAAYNVAAESDFTIVNKGEVNVNSDVRVGVHVINRNVFNIATGSMLMVNNNKKFINETGEPTENGFVKLEYGGVVNNDGWFGIEDDSKAIILNFGTINLLSDEARLYITANATGGTTEKYEEEYNGTPANVTTEGMNNGNKIGSIVLYDKNAGSSNVKVNRENKQGFIKLVVTAEDATEADYGVVANYIILDEGVKTYADAKSVKYVEVAKNAGEIRFTGETELNGLIVNPGRKINIPEEVTVTINKATYLQGIASVGGVFTYKQFTGYFGGKDTDKENIMNYGSTNNK